MENDVPPHSFVIMPQAIKCQIIYRLAALFVLITLFIGQATGNSLANEDVSVPKLIDFRAELDNIGQPRYIEVKNVEAQFRAVSPTMRNFYCNHTIKRIILPDEGWVREAIRVSQYFFRDFGVKWHAESWDCDNFSMFVSAVTTLKLWSAGFTNTRCGFGWMVIDGKHNWGGIGQGRHALVFAVTGKGVMVIEPQTGAMIELDRYPNKAYIDKVILL